MLDSIWIQQNNLTKLGILGLLTDWQYPGQEARMLKPVYLELTGKHGSHKSHVFSMFAVFIVWPTLYDLTQVIDQEQLAS
jgi:hypothetical protein